MTADLQLPVLALAYGADLLLGDPAWFPHPVRGMGLAIHWGERMLRRAIPPPVCCPSGRMAMPSAAGDQTGGGTIPWERLAGIVLVAILVPACFGGTWWLLRIIDGSSHAWGFLAQVVLLFSCLSTKDLAVESRQVLQALEAHDLPLARQRVARIVGRDTAHLDQREIARATVETIAESTMDGILSPLFYFVLGGVPLAVAYKAINTLDSMIGHRSARYIRFGWAAAKVDTWANWLPARWSAVVFVVAAWSCRGRVRESWRCAWHEGSEGTVPNAGIPEAAMAGALGIQLGGVNWYDGKPVEMPAMGKPIRRLEPPRIREAIQLMSVASLVAWGMAMIALLVIGSANAGLPAYD